MWMLAFIPDAFLAWIINTILITGIIGFAASFFFGYVVRWLPAIAPYHLLIQVVSIVLLVAGVYFKGGYSVEMAWRERVAELEAKIAISEQKSKEVNEKSPTAQRMLKFSFNLIDDGLVGQQIFAGEATRLAYMTDEAEEGRDSFLEKRDADWSRFPWYY